jgi:hypothetical protein
MLMIRDIMHCKPGQVRPMVKKFLALSALIQREGLGKMRVLTDLSAERYWTVVSEMEVESLQKWSEGMQRTMQIKDFQDVMAGYHDIVIDGRREIYTIESA